MLHKKSPLLFGIKGHSGYTIFSVPPAFEPSSSRSLIPIYICWRFVFALRKRRELNVCE
jgi:peroxiredoxin